MIDNIERGGVIIFGILGIMAMVGGVCALLLEGIWYCAIVLSLILLLWIYFMYLTYKLI